MKSQIDFPFKDYADNESKCVSLLARYLKNGQLSLLFGSGVSQAFGLPGWKDLMMRLCTAKGITFDKKKLGGGSLKQLASDLKRTCTEQEYLELVREELYRDVNFDLSMVTKSNMLIALTSLLMGSVRGKVTNVVTYNFDNIIEWFLQINGLSVNVVSPRNLLTKSHDVEILHVHGYLPHKSSPDNTSLEIVLAREEFEDRAFSQNIWKDLMKEYTRKFIFLSIGVSSESLIVDLGPYLREEEKFYTAEATTRQIPFGIAFLTTETTDQQRVILMESGIIPCTIDKKIIPSVIFKISQEALRLGS